MKNNITEASRLEYQQTREAIDNTVLEERRKTWRDRASTLSPRTPTFKVWQTLKGLDGRSKKRLPDTPLTAGTKKFDTDSKKADHAVATYAEVSRVNIPREEEKEAYLDVHAALKKGTSCEELDETFYLEELEKVLQKTKNSAPGADEMHPLLLKHLPESGKTRLLRLINRSWTQAKVPSHWRRAVIIPILKKEKTASEVKSYRPVSLLSSISKTAEALVTRRLKKWAEEEHVIPDEQSGFQTKGSTLDAIANIAQTAMDNLQFQSCF